MMSVGTTALCGRTFILIKHNQFAISCIVIGHVTWSVMKADTRNTRHHNGFSPGGAEIVTFHSNSRAPRGTP